MEISTSDARLTTLRNLATAAERAGLTEASAVAFRLFWMGDTGRATVEQISNTTANLRDILAYRLGRDVANAIR
jgi:hypothetical protein